jgi:hypothetical protein
VLLIKRLPQFLFSSLQLVCFLRLFGAILGGSFSEDLLDISPRLDFRIAILASLDFASYLWSDRSEEAGGRIICLRFFPRSSCVIWFSLS